MYLKYLLNNIIRPKRINPDQDLTNYEIICTTVAHMIMSIDCKKNLSKPQLVIGVTIHWKFWSKKLTL